MPSFLPLLSRLLPLHVKAVAFFLPHTLFPGNNSSITNMKLVTLVNASLVSIIMAAPHRQCNPGAYRCESDLQGYSFCSSEGKWIVGTQPTLIPYPLLKLVSEKRMPPWNCLRSIRRFGAPDVHLKGTWLMEVISM